MILNNPYYVNKIKSIFRLIQSFFSKINLSLHLFSYDIVVKKSSSMQRSNIKECSYKTKGNKDKGFKKEY